MISQTHKLDVVPGGVTAVVHVKQYQTGESLVFELFSRFGDFEISAAYTECTVRGTKSDGNGYSANATCDPSNNSVTVELTEQMTAVAGRQPYEITITESTGRMITTTFILDVHRAALDADTVESASVIREVDAVVEDYMNEHGLDYVNYPTTPDSKYGTAGQSLRTKGDGRTEWADVGLPTDAQTATAITAWLNAHPEATTTVADGAVTEAKIQSGAVSEPKLNSRLLSRINNDVDTFTVGTKTISAKRLKESNYSRELISKELLTHYTNDNTYVWLQSAVYVNSLGHVVLGFTKSDYSKGMLVEVGKDFKTVIKRVGNLEIGHANDMTYNPTTDKIYVAPMSTGSNANKVVVIEPSTLTVSSTINIGSTVYQISYDKLNEVYYLGTSTLDIYDTSFNLISTKPIGDLSDYGINDTGQGSHCIDGNFIIVSQDNLKTYFRTFDLTSGDVSQYQSYNNYMYKEEAEALLDFDDYMYSVSGQKYLYAIKYAIKDTASDQTGNSVYDNGKPIDSNSDLNDYLAEGKYFSGSAQITATLSHVPNGCGSGFSLYVLNQGQDWLVQILIENSNRKKIYFRTYNAGSFGDWRRNNDVFLRGDEIPASSDLNSYTVVGKYYSVDATRTASLSHVPSECGSGFSLYVIEQGYDWIVQIMIENSNRRKIYFRTYSSSTWGTWRLKNKEAVSSTAISEGGTYQIPSEMLDYDVITISCNRNYYFGSVTVSVKAIKNGDLANGTICLSDLTHYWTITISNTGLITVTGISGVSAPYVRLIAQ